MLGHDDPINDPINRPRVVDDLKLQRIVLRLGTIYMEQIATKLLDQWQKKRERDLSRY